MREDGDPVRLPGVGRALAVPPRDAGSPRYAARQPDSVPIPAESRRYPQVMLHRISPTPCSPSRLCPHSPPSHRSSPGLTLLSGGRRGTG